MYEKHNTFAVGKNNFDFILVVVILFSIPRFEILKFKRQNLLKFGVLDLLSRTVYMFAK